MTRSEAGGSEPTDASTYRPDLAGITALVIDDDLSSVDLLVAVLEQFGARVIGARSAEEARRVIAAVTPDIVICDLVLPREHGFIFIRWLRSEAPERGRRIPAVAITFFYDQFNARDARDAGFDMFLRKPVDPMDLVHAAAILVNRRRTP